MPARDQLECIEEGRADDEGIGEDGGGTLEPVQGVHEEEDFELTHGGAGDVADGGCEGDEDVDGDGVAVDREDGIVLTLAVDTGVLVGAGAVGLAVDYHHQIRLIYPSGYLYEIRGCLIITKS